MRKFLAASASVALCVAAAAACVEEPGTSVVERPDAGGRIAPPPTPDAIAPVVDAGGDAAASADDAGDAAAQSYALFVGTDFTKGELAVVGLSPPAVLGRLALDDQDSVPYASGGLGFLLERGLGKVIALDPARPWMARATLDVNDAPDAASYASNPRAVVVTAGAKAYVARYKSNKVKVVDPVSGTASADLDLSSFLGAGDPDGLVEVTDAAYDASTRRAYFLLERIDQFDFGGAPDYVGKCLPFRGMLVGIDTTTNTPVDLNGAATGVAIELLGSNPGSLTVDFAAGRAIVADAGCYVASDGGTDAGTARAGRGVESIDLTTGISTWLFQTSDVERLDELVWADATHAYVSMGRRWFAWNPREQTLGAELPTFPKAPRYDGNGRVIGLSVVAADAGAGAGAAWSVVAWNVATGELSTLAANPFQSVQPALAFGTSSALIR